MTRRTIKQKTIAIYPSPYINVNGDHWTKHYYIGDARVASMTGTLSGGFDDLHILGNHPASAGTGVPLNYSAMRLAVEDSVASVYARLGVPYEPQRVGTRGEGGHLYIPITRDEENAGDIGAETAETSDGSLLRSHPNTLGEGQVYYYHRDHLGSTQSVTDGAGNIAQMVEYTPWGEVFVELKGDSILTTPYLFNGKELDEETGLYYYGARYYHPKMSVWYSTDPMEMEYSWVTTYGYCINNPVKWYDLNGEDWYQDEDGTLQYNPDVHSQKNLEGTQKYLYKERNYKEQGISYRKDGSILYENETVAYNRMWSQANTHYRKNRNGGREVGGFILDNGYVLVLPDYLNDSRTTKTLEYGYRIENSKLTKGSESFSVLAQIHTHQDTSASPKPSYWMGEIRGDFDVSLSMGGKPVFTIGHDGGIYALIAIKKNSYCRLSEITFWL